MAVHRQPVASMGTIARPKSARVGPEKVHPPQPAPKVIPGSCVEALGRRDGNETTEAHLSRPVLENRYCSLCDSRLSVPPGEWVRDNVRQVLVHVPRRSYLS